MVERRYHLYSLIDQSMTASQGKTIVTVHKRTFLSRILPTSDILHWINQDRDLSLALVFYESAALDCFLFHCNLITHLPAIHVRLQNWKKSTVENGIILGSKEKETDHAVGAAEEVSFRFPERFEFFSLFSSLFWNGLKRVSTTTVNTMYLETTESQGDE